MVFAISVSPFIEVDNLNPDSWLYVAMFRYPQELGGVGGSWLDEGWAWGVGGGLFRQAGRRKSGLFFFFFF
jgi:hypothetical protein